MVASQWVNTWRNEAEEINISGGMWRVGIGDTWWNVSISTESPEGARVQSYITATDEVAKRAVIICEDVLQ